MTMKAFATALIASGAVIAGTAICGPASAQAVISNGNISLGVNNEGHLNVDAPRPGTGFGVGVYDNRTDFESTYDGCKCEGWGVANAADGTTAYAGVDTGGVVNLDLVSFVATASTATSIVDVVNGTSSMQVTHAYAPSISPDLYQAVVTITNTGSNTIDDLRYRRGMDWDIEPTAFSEYVTIGGTSASALLFSSDNGFAIEDPLIPAGTLIAPISTDFTDLGPADHGAVFDFGFGSLDPGASYTFSIFYGASLSERSAYAALNAVGAELYSLGQSNDNIDGDTPDRSTFIFGFKGVGGTVIPPMPAVPEPTAWAMLLAGAGMIGSALRRRRRVSIAFA